LEQGDSIGVDFLPDAAPDLLVLAKKTSPPACCGTCPARPPRRGSGRTVGAAGELGNMTDKALNAAEARLRDWRFTPNGSEGFAKAEVTAGGISTADLSSKTMEAKKVPGLYAIGEAVDVTGWLGGYNFQWAWASGSAAAGGLRKRRCEGHRPRAPLTVCVAHKVQPKSYGRRAAGMNRKHCAIKPDACGAYVAQVESIGRQSGVQGVTPLLQNPFFHAKAAPYHRANRHNAPDPCARTH
jgi:hypothetical protein